MELISKPIWLRVSPPGGESYTKIKQTLRSNNLHTVCEEARCPNLKECWGAGTATIMIMGNICSRGCRFCSVKSGKPVLLDPYEPNRVAEAIRDWGLKYVVITSVCRDDIEDGGAEHISKTIRAVKKLCPEIIVEMLIPDFGGDTDSVRRVAASMPEVISHNVETVRRLSSKIRDARASYEQSLCVLKYSKAVAPSIYTKSSIMLGLGESEEEIIETMEDLRSVGVDILTMGQYLQPTHSHSPVLEYIEPAKFERLKKIAETKGYPYVASGPLVRSSYRAGEVYLKLIAEKHVSIRIA